MGSDFAVALLLLLCALCSAFHFNCSQLKVHYRVYIAVFIMIDLHGNCIQYFSFCLATFPFYSLFSVHWPFILQLSCIIDISLGSIYRQLIKKPQLSADNQVMTEILITCQHILSQFVNKDFSREKILKFSLISCHRFRRIWARVFSTCQSIVTKMSLHKICKKTKNIQTHKNTCKLVTELFELANLTWAFAKFGNNLCAL